MFSFLLDIIEVPEVRVFICFIQSSNVLFPVSHGRRDGQGIPRYGQAVRDRRQGTKKCHSPFLTSNFVLDSFDQR
jgi:hypothetical protein